jgi:hypothetical protein
MGGGLLQLVAYGAQDVYLTGNPQITFFKVVYRRHTNFAMEAIQQTFNGVTQYGNTVTCQISRNGDLINRMYLQLTVPATAGGAKYVNYLGARLINNIIIEIGGQQIDKHYSDWLYIWNELSLPLGKKSGYNDMIGADSAVTSNGTTLYIPLEFWFCRNVGLALPLIALQYHEVKIKLQFETKDNCRVGGTTLPDLTDVNIWVDYIFLDTDERRRFAQVKHEYLIEQLQFSGDENVTTGSTTRVKLNFNHPCKEIIWVAKKSEPEYWYNYTSSNIWNETGAILGSGVSDTHVLPSMVHGTNPFGDCLLQLNGNDRFASRKGNYFSLVQPYQHHTAIPLNKGINVYSFSLKPEDHQPSGSLNMSRIDTAVLSLQIPTGYGPAGGGSAANYSGAKIFAVNYNVLRILSGMGGLAYSN